MFIFRMNEKNNKKNWPQSKHNCVLTEFYIIQKSGQKMKENEVRRKKIFWRLCCLSVFVGKKCKNFFFFNYFFLFKIKTFLISYFLKKICMYFFSLIIFRRTFYWTNFFIMLFLIKIILNEIFLDEVFLDEIV